MRSTVSQTSPDSDSSETRQQSSSVPPLHFVERGAEGEDDKRSRLWLSVAVLLGLAAWLVVNFPLNSLWYDEALTAYVATDSWATLWRWCTQVDIQVPLHYVVLRLWTGALGDSEFSLRLLSAVCVLLAAAALIAIGRRLIPTRYNSYGLITAILLGALPGVLWIAYEVRAYALALALFAWATVLLCEILRTSTSRRVDRRWGLLIGYALLMLAALYTQYTAFGALAAHAVILGVFILARRSMPLLRASITAAVLIGIGFAPWLPVMLARGAADRSFYAGAPITPQHSIPIIVGFTALARDDASSAAPGMVAAYGILLVLGALVGWIGWRRWERAATVAVMIAVWPMLAVAVLVYFKPKLAGRYAWPAWIGFALLSALVITALISIFRRWRPVRGLMPAAVMIAIIVLPWSSTQRGSLPDSDFRAAFAYICTHGDPGDVIGLRDGTLFVVADYYGRRAPCTSERTTVSLPTALLTNVDQALTLPIAQVAMAEINKSQPPNVWIVAWQGDVMDPQAMAYALLDGTGKHSVVDMRFGDVRLDRYEQPQPITGDPLALATPLNVTPVPNGPTLVAARVFAPQVAQAGATVVVQAWWQRGPALQPDLRVSVQVTSLDGGWTYAQPPDQPPAGWKYVDDRWQIGVPALGRYELKIGPDVPPGKVLIRYVLYDALSRWSPVILKLGEITVTR